MKLLKITIFELLETIYAGKPIKRFIYNDRLYTLAKTNFIAYDSGNEALRGISFSELNAQIEVVEE